jgi:integrase
MSNSNRESKNSQVKKPRKDFPLFPHRSGRWCKKVRGQFHYFGKVADDPNGQVAINLWLDQRDDLLAGRKPRIAGKQGLTVADACNHYLARIDEQVQRGERSERWHDDLERTLAIMLKVVGRNWSVDSLRQEDFANIAKRFWLKRSGKKLTAKASPITVANHIHRVKGFFNWLVKDGLLDRIPAYGSAFDPPDKNVVERHRNDSTERYFNRKQVRALLRSSKDNPRMFAAILLAINCGCQNEDIATLKLKHLDLDKGWYFQPRSKKAKKRRAKLWPRTVKALKSVIGDRELDDEGLIFLSLDGKAWHGRNCLAKEFAKLKKLAGIKVSKSGFQWLRHSFITQASQSEDLIAVQLVCGHADRTITKNYIHRIYDPRLVAIANTVDTWLIGKGGDE